MGTQEIMMEFIRELIGERWINVRVGRYISQSKQTDLGIPQGGVRNETRFLVAINGILGELGNGVDGLLFSDDLAINITTKTHGVASRALQRVTKQVGCLGSRKGFDLLPQKNSKQCI